MYPTTRNSNLPGSTRRAWGFGSTVLTVFLGLGLTLAARAHDANGGDDLGTLPGHGGAGDEDRIVDTRPAVFLEAPSSEALSGLVVAYSGEFSLHEVEVTNGVRWILKGSGFEVAIDEGLMASRSIEMGVTASQFAGPVLARLEWPGVVTPGHVIPSGGVLDLPYARMQDAGLLDEPVAVHTLSDRREETSFTVTSGSGLLCLRHD